MDLSLEICLQAMEVATCSKCTMFRLNAIIFLDILKNNNATFKFGRHVSDTKFTNVYIFL